MREGEGIYTTTEEERERERMECKSCKHAGGGGKSRRLPASPQSSLLKTYFLFFPGEEFFLFFFPPPTSSSSSIVPTVVGASAQVVHTPSSLPPCSSPPRYRPLDDTPAFALSTACQRPHVPYPEPDQAIFSEKRRPRSFPPPSFSFRFTCPIPPCPLHQSA